jgi:hypothetical protein
MLVDCTLLCAQDHEVDFLLPVLCIVLAGVQLSPEQKKSAALNPASATKPSNTSITDIIESVVSAAREDDTSKDSASSISKSGMNCAGGTQLEGDHDFWNKSGDIIYSNHSSGVFSYFFHIGCLFLN